MVWFADGVLKVSHPNNLVYTFWYILHNDRYQDKLINNGLLYSYEVSKGREFQRTSRTVLKWHLAALDQYIHLN